MSLSNGKCIRCTLITSIIITIVCTKRDNNGTHDTLHPRLWPTKNSCLHTSIIPSTYPTCGNTIFTFTFYIFILIILTFNMYTG